MKIGVLDSGYDSYSIEENYVKKYGYELEVFDKHYGDISEKIKFSKDKVGLLIRQSEIDRNFLDQCTELEAIVRYGIGYDNIDLTEAKEHGVKVANVQGYATFCVAEHAMALMFACLRGLKEGQRQIRSGFGKPPFRDIFELKDKTLGIIGLGRIGSRFARICKPLFDKILATDPYIKMDRFAEYGVIQSDIDELIAQSHVISIHCNLTEETTYLIDKSRLIQMKKRPLIINTARGPIVNEKDLISALNKDRIHSAGIDVWEDEPLSGKQQPLVDHPRVISTGHYAWYSDCSSMELQKRAVENIIGLLKGEKVEDRLV